MSKIIERIYDFETLFGIPFSKNSTLFDFLKEKISSWSKYDGVDEATDLFTFANVFYETEGSLLSAPAPDQSPYILASHICGLLELELNTFFLKMNDIEAFRLDIYELLQNSTSTIYLCNHEEKKIQRQVSYKMFSSLAEFGQCQKEFRNLRSSQLVENESDEKNRIQLAEAFATKYPGLVTWMHDKFLEYGCKQPDSFVPEYNINLTNALKAAFYFAGLYGNMNISEPDNLDIFFNKGKYFSENYPPHRILNLFTLHYKGHKNEAENVAHEMVQDNGGIPLVERWGQRYLENHLFFSRIGQQ